MATQKTRPTPASVEAFLQAIGDPRRQRDCRALLELMRHATGAEPRMWGAGIIGFGSYHYRYASGHEGDTFVLGFSPRKGALALYLCPSLGRFQELLERLGRHKTGKGCLYIRTLEDVDKSVLATLLKQAAATLPVAAASTAAGG